MNDLLPFLAAAQIVIIFVLALIFGSLGWKLIEKTTLETELIRLKIEKLQREADPGGAEASRVRP
jgi:hypothetical protein